MADLTQAQPERDRREQERRWRLMLGQDDPGSPLSESDKRLNQALAALYDSSEDAGNKGRGSLSRSAPRVARWLGDIREFFPGPMVQVIQRDALERLGLKEMLLQPEFLATVEADVHLVADLISLRSVMPEKTLQTARQVIGKVVQELLQRLQQRTAEAVRGAVDRSRRTSRPRHADIDWGRTLRANLRHYQPQYRSVVPETLVGFMRRQRRQADLDEVILCVDQSGSMATSVVYASIFAAVLASLPVVRTRLVCFDTVVLDLTEELADPVQVLFGVQLGGGTDINQALGYCERLLTQPQKTHMVLISDLYEGGDGAQLLARAAALVRQGVNLIVLLALSDDGRPAYDARMAEAFAALGAPVFACTPDQFPALMATALRREDVLAWAADQDIRAVRPT
ncbi:VWA domain-containing protein [Xanthomonas arboricola]|uniref:VWA domain-containing protein n=1 Tax=Xanthomonas arboricola TaxID=56448 RepID=UPI001FD70168|nr:VWA domain-containing protein [Xanthomonas arboricola]UOT00316.1 VWA domain-containing protein [Xanthomonas arboricola]